MANYDPSDLVKAQGKLIGMFQNSELRYRDPVTFTQILRESDIMFPNYQELRTREDRPIDAYFRTRTSRALGTGGRTHNHTGSKGDTSVLIPSWTTYDDDFSLSLKQGDNNVYSNAEMLANEYENVVANFAEGMETAAVNFLFNGRSGVNVSTAEGTFDAADDVFQITESTNGDRAIQITKGVMHENKYGSRLTVYCDTVAFNKFGYQANQGNANNQNLSFQFGGVNFVHSVELGALAAGLTTPITKGFWITVEEGNVGALPWIPKQNRQGVVVEPISRYGTLMNPVDGLTYANHTYSIAEDGTATNGYTQDVLTQFELSIDMAFEAAPLTTANETVIQAFGLV